MLKRLLFISLLFFLVSGCAADLRVALDNPVDTLLKTGNDFCNMYPDTRIFRVEVPITNAGTVKSTPTSVGIWVMARSHLSGPITRSIPLQSLNPGETQTISFDITKEDCLGRVDAFSCYFVVCVDPQNLVIEGEKKRNNTLVSSCIVHP